MTFLISLTLQILGIALATTLLAILVERVLIINGFTQGNTTWLLFFTFISVILAQLANLESPMYLFLVIVFISVMSMNRFDLIKTIKRGRWWWKKHNLSADQNKETQ
jgi:hypothetical protein